ncbi:MAG TPA: ABC transporter ATP-binding protein [Ramlibacter sp.]|jgi:lipopolysaccharide transport system ATP-binding protein
MDRVLTWFGLSRPPLDERWVLRDINVSVQPGQALGIVGRNGAGKSTLLKMITGTTRPTVGSIHARGKIAAILELGMGFNPEFSGRQNAVQSAGMMGFDRAAIEHVMAQIIEFSELGDYFDQPLRVYSSGMQMRLAFSVATAFRPDVLIIDEALSVGDAYFQHKSFDRIRAFRDLGTTLIIVSHDKAALQSICDRAILLEEGRVALDGDPEAVLDYYNALLAQRAGEEIETVQHASGRTQTISGSRLARIEDVHLRDEADQVVETVGVGDAVQLIVAAQTVADLPALVMGFAIKDRFGRTIFGTNTFYSGQLVTNVTEGELVHYRTGFEANFSPGTYSVSVALSGTESHLEANYEWRDLALVFTVVNLDKPPFDGAMFLRSNIKVERSAS